MDWIGTKRVINMIITTYPLFYRATQWQFMYVATVSTDGTFLVSSKVISTTLMDLDTARNNVIFLCYWKRYHVDIYDHWERRVRSRFQKIDCHSSNIENPFL